MRPLALLLVLLLCACGPRPDPQPDSASPEEAGRAFASALLEKADAAEAMRWADPSAALDVRSQAGFLAAPGRRVKHTPERPVKVGEVTTMTVRIDELELGDARYRGQLLLRMVPSGRRVLVSSLVLERSDGVQVSL